MYIIILHTAHRKWDFFSFELFAQSEQKKFLKYYLLVFHETNNDNDPFENVDFI